MAARAKDGIVAIPDRKESVDGSLGNEAAKRHTDAAGGSRAVLAGDRTAARHLLNRPGRGGVANAGIFRELGRQAAVLYADHQKAGHAAGRLIAASKGKLELHAVSIVSGIAVFAPGRDPSRRGRLRRIVLCKDQARGMPLPDTSCKAATKRLHAMAGHIAEAIDGAEAYSKYGTERAALAMSGTASKTARCTNKTCALAVRFIERGAKPPSRNGGA